MPELLHRGQKGPSPLGTTIFTTLRSTDLLLQHHLLTTWSPRLITTLNGTPLTPPADLTLPLLATPVSAYHALILTFAAGSTAKQIFWLLFTAEEKMPAKAAVVISFFNSLINAANLTLSLNAATSPARLGSPQVLVGSALYVLGMGLEVVSEVQRRRFKKVPRNRGRPCAVGLWGWATNVNYGGYLLWRTGYSLAAGGVVAGLVMGGWTFWDFTMRAVPTMHAYCEKRYGDDWKKIAKEVPYKLIPGIY